MPVERNGELKWQTVKPHYGRAIKLFPCSQPLMLMEDYVCGETLSTERSKRYLKQIKHRIIE